MKGALNHRIRRNIVHNLSYYISASLLTAISVYLMVAMYSAVLMLQRDFDDILVTGNVEDAQFTTLYPISDNDLVQMEQKFEVEVEKIQYVDIQSNKNTLRVFLATQKINKYQLLEGSDIHTPKEILVNRDYMLNNDLKLGDELIIEGNQYTICGEAVRPDYLYAQKQLTDFYVDKKSFGQVTMNTAAFEQLPSIQSYYSIVYTRDNEQQVRKYINDTYYSLSYLSAKSNNRIEMASGFMKEMMLNVSFIMPLFFIIIVIIVAVVCSRTVQKERKLIGTLIALGYRKKELMKHYAVYASLPGIVGTFLGIIMVLPTLGTVCAYFAMDYETINYHTVLHVPSFIIALILPTLLYFLTGIIVSGKMMRENTIHLLSGNQKIIKQKQRKLFVHSKLSFRNKYRIRTLLQNKSRTVVVLIGMFMGSFLCLLSFMLVDSCHRMIEQGMDAAGSYEYQYYLNTVLNNAPDSGEPMIAMEFDVKNFTKKVEINGIVNNPKYLNLTTVSGERATLDGFYMTTNAAALFDVKKGDVISLIHPLTMNELKITITDLIQDNVQRSIYANINEVGALLGLDSGSYNVIMSDEPVNIDPKLVALTYQKKDMKEQFEYTIRMLYKTIYLLIGFGILLCVIAVYLTVNMLIQENVSHISMLKVLGYSNQRINSLVLNTNHILIPISFLLSILACKQTCIIMFKKYISVLNIYLEPSISIRSILLCFGILILSYWLSLNLLKRKVFRVNMVESLKDNRE